MSLYEKVLWQIESRLREEITLEKLAELCAVSVYHMVRTFSQATGLPPMAYLRARRLTEAARSLSQGAGDIAQVAFDARYSSHEAFTRAFFAHFGVLPNVVRAQKSFDQLNVMEAMPMKKDLIVDIEPPQKETMQAVKIVGVSCNCTFENTSEIPRAWTTFNARVGEIECANRTASYGVCFNVNEEGKFRYLAGTIVERVANVPDGMEVIELPKSDYAVFSHKGHISEISKTVHTAWNKILPEMGWKPRKTPDFERYDHRFNPETGRGIVEIWIPLESAD